MGQKIIPGHELKPLSRSIVPRNMIFVDTETTKETRTNGKTYHKLRLGVGIYSRLRTDRHPNYKEVYRFETPEEFWSWVISKQLKKTVLYVISHNVVFDFTVLKHITILTKAGYSCIFTYEGGVRYIGKWRKESHTIMILDNSNWFAGTVAKWGKELDLPKLTMPKGVDGKEKWFVYCERDCEILYELSKWYIAFLRDNRLGSWKYTIASSAFTAFRHRFMPHPIYIPGTCEENAIARASYHGGRTECFQVGTYDQGPYYKLDINSMYPYVMRKESYPTCYQDSFTNPNMDKVRKTLDNYCLIADVTLTTPYPYFCYRKEDRNIYPIGTFRTTLSTEELILAFDNKWIQTVHQCAVYRKRRIFHEYVDFFLPIKINASREGKPLLRSLAKLYLNSLYGKFGQKGYVDYIIGQDTKNTLQVSHGYNLQSRERFTIRQMGRDVLYSERSGEGYNSFSAIASHVTANARMYLYSLILVITRQDCFYCDTDSIIVNERGMKRIASLLDNTRLGYLKVEGTSDVINIVAPKHYLFDNHWTVKGIRKDAVKLSENTYRQEIWPGLNTILKTGEEAYFNYYQEKTLSPTIISGQVSGDGTIAPFLLG